MRGRIGISFFLFLFLLNSEFYIFALLYSLFYYATFHKITNFTNLNQKIVVKRVLKSSLGKSIDQLKLLGLVVVLTLDFRIFYPPTAIALILKTFLVTAALDIVFNYDNRGISNDPQVLVSKFTSTNEIQNLHHQIFNSCQFRQRIFDDLDQPSLWKRILINLYWI